VREVGSRAGRMGAIPLRPRASRPRSIRTQKPLRSAPNVDSACPPRSGWPWRPPAQGADGDAAALENIW